jgi:2-C-methyl-D-erythritol 4-phosphate cytidylyltransferase
VWTIVLGGGGGERFGGPKQFADLGGRSVLDRSVEIAKQTGDGVVVVLPAHVEWDGPTDVRRANGGETRSQSTRNGLALVPTDAAIVVVHDGARPLASAEVFRLVIDAVTAGADAAIPALPMTDTVKRVDGAHVVETIDRSNLVTVQTPQAFAATKLREAHKLGDDDTDDAALVERIGGRVVVVAGEPRNIKITLPVDLLIATALLEPS